MGSENVPDGRKQRSFIEQARRAQIIRAAIETIAEQGYANAGCEVSPLPRSDSRSGSQW